MSETNNVRFIHPAGLGPTPNYTHVVEVTSGRMIFTSGQVPLDEANNLVGGDDFAAQAHQVFKNIGIALAAAGADFTHIIKLNYYLTDFSDLPRLREIRNQYINTAQPPASTAVEVNCLFRDDVMIEVEAVAVLP
ncbi:MAG TPA: RidA family protein [Phototrophicaceae bacterium]|jgi:reactive intermediate/imine deaminase|nr:RidA family protein [Phototrophicaceae bacterium]